MPSHNIKFVSAYVCSENFNLNLLMSDQMPGTTRHAATVHCSAPGIDHAVELKFLHILTFFILFLKQTASGRRKKLSRVGLSANKQDSKDIVFGIGGCKLSRTSVSAGREHA